jgi:hypothetical protein
VGGSIPPPLSIELGLRFHATSDVKVLQLGVDLGFLEKTVDLEWCWFDQNVMERVWEHMCGGHNAGDEPMYREYEVVSMPPNWWFDVVSYEYPETLPEDPEMAFDRISTIMSWSSVLDT